MWYGHDMQVYCVSSACTPCMLGWMPYVLFTKNSMNRISVPHNFFKVSFINVTLFLSRRQLTIKAHYVVKIRLGSLDTLEILFAGWLAVFILPSHNPLIINHGALIFRFFFLTAWFFFTCKLHWQGNCDYVVDYVVKGTINKVITSSH